MDIIEPSEFISNNSEKNSMLESNIVNDSSYKLC